MIETPTVSQLHFDKYEGLGNDFIVVDVARESDVEPEMARRLCDRRFGVGADGVLLVMPPAAGGHVARMRVVNADGSVPEMCGNGLRCVALHVARTRNLETLAGAFETDAGLRQVTLDREGDRASVTVDMGPARVIGEREIDLGDERVTIIEVDVGNPHAILLPIEAAHDRARIERLGPLVERHASFPRGTNVELVTREPDALRLTVWERGVGFTLACGTGACATVAALVARGEWSEGKEALVRLPGGDLSIIVKDGRATMRGPARRVYSGSVT